VTLAVVITDTSPVRALNHLELLPLLGRLFGSVFVPPSVADELLHPIGGPPVDVRIHSYFVLRAPSDARRAAALGFQLDPAETEAISLAMELKATIVLMDEKAGRAAAVRAGITPVGVLGLLIRGKNQGMIQQVGPLIIRLRDELNFHISPALENHIRGLAGE
jgi:predicted nucleic acid-binding protein